MIATSLRVGALLMPVVRAVAEALRGGRLSLRSTIDPLGGA